MTEVRIPVCTPVGMNGVVVRLSFTGAPEETNLPCTNIAKSGHFFPPVFRHGVATSTRKG